MLYGTGSNERIICAFFPFFFLRQEAKKANTKCKQEPRKMAPTSMGGGGPLARHTTMSEVTMYQATRTPPRTTHQPT